MAPAPGMIVQAFVLGINHLLRAEAWAQRSLVPYAGQTVRIVAPPLRVVMIVTPEGLLAEAAAERVDVEFALPAGAPLVALRGREAMLREARVAGAADFAQAFADVLRQLRWDYEEDLARVVGDVAARRLTAAARRAGAWPAEAARRLGENVSEYLREERPVLAARSGLGRFADSVAELASALDALEARLRRLEHGAAGSSRDGPPKASAAAGKKPA